MQGAWLKWKEFNTSIVRKEKAFSGLDDLQAALTMKALTNHSTAIAMSHLERKLMVADRIKQLRENSGLSQRDIAKELHIGQSTYHRMEKGQSEPSAVQIATLSSLYGETYLWLLGLPTFIVKVR